MSPVLHAVAVTMHAVCMVSESACDQKIRYMHAGRQAVAQKCVAWPVTEIVGIATYRSTKGASCARLRVQNGILAMQKINKSCVKCKMLALLERKESNAPL